MYLLENNESPKSDYVVGFEMIVDSTKNLIESVTRAIHSCSSVEVASIQ